MKRPVAGRSFTNGFSGPKSSREFREMGPWGLSFQGFLATA